MADDVTTMRVGANLIVALRGDLDDSSVERIQRDVTSEVSQTQPTGVLLNVSGLIMVDSYVARVIARLISMIRLLGAQAAIAGIQPAVAISLVELGAPLADVTTALNTEQGLTRLRGLINERAG
jgi:rsbT antagonist protein RsbS